LVVIYLALPLEEGVKTAMSHKQANLLRTIFNDPHAANIHWREVESLLNHLGANLEASQGARFKVTLNGVVDFLHHPHHGSECTRDHIKHLREFLLRAGVSLSAYEAEKDKSGN
jgi:hypothetical protein